MAPGVVVPLLLLALAAGGLLTPSASPVSAGPTSSLPDLGPGSRPNIVLIMTDDMALSDLEQMPRTRRLLGGRGMTFTEGLAPNPVCCPARASVLTGMESHNNGVWSNKAPHGGYGSLTEGTRLPEWLQEAGYRTAFLGKHLNNFTSSSAEQERGWDVLDALVRGVYAYRSFTTWDNGRLHAVRRGYVTDHLSRATGKAIRRFDRDDAAPFFLWAGHVAPHAARPRTCLAGDCWRLPIPASEDKGDFAGVTSPTRSLPSYNHKNGLDKPPFLRPLRRQSRHDIDDRHQRRIESLQSVDRSVAETVRQLRESAELRRTMLVFTSDHGYLLGQHRYVGKRLPYEESLRVPLLVRAPGVPPGATSDQLTTSVDLNRTIVELAGAESPHALDGVSMLPALAGGEGARSVTLLQSGATVAYEGDGSTLGGEPADHGWLYRGYRDERYTYVRYPDPSGESTQTFEELYDRWVDPYQLSNKVGSDAYEEVLARARKRAQQLATCAGSQCHPPWEVLPPPR